MISIEGEEKKPVLWPGGSLAHLGKNPYGENIWRVVWSESRNFMFKAQDSNRFEFLPLYRGKSCYILERWISGWQYSKCTPETWGFTNKELGPYPSRGVYFGPCWEFEGYPTISAVEAIVNLIERGDQYSDYERAQAVIQAQEKEDALRFHAAKEIIMDSLPTNVTRGTFLPSAMKRAEEIPERFSAQDISKLKGIPLGENKSFTSGVKRI